MAYGVLTEEEKERLALANILTDHNILQNNMQKADIPLMSLDYLVNTMPAEQIEGYINNLINSKDEGTRVQGLMLMMEFRNAGKDIF